MPVELRVEGAAQFEKVAHRLKDLGDKDLTKALRQGIKKATEPIRLDVQQAATRDLPKRGGLNRWVAASNFSVSTTTGKTPRVRLTGKRKNAGGKQSDLAALDRGQLRHPVFGNRKVWVLQQVRPGWFSKTVNSDIDNVRSEVNAAVEDVARRL